MPTEITMPKLGESVTEGTIGKWLKRPGERVEKYEALLEVTTDKVDTEVPAPEAGVLREIAVPEGTTVKVGTLLALLDSAADTAASGKPAEATADKPAAGAATHNGSAPAAGSQAFVSPVVARLVAEHNLDLSQIAGTGQGGRVSKQDVLKYIESRAAARAAAKPPETRAGGSAPPTAPTREPALQEAASTGPQPGAPAEAPSIPDDAELVPVTPMRRAIAEHMLHSRRTAPHVTSVFEIDASRIVAHRERRKAEFARQGVKLTFTPYFAQAAAAALRAVPSVNASYAESGIIQHERVHIGVAVALDDGLIVPVLRDADEKNLLGLARGVNDLADRARAHRLKPDDTSGGTFTITNHGVGGSLFATPIINQPQAAILGIGAIQKRAVVVSQGGVDAIAIRPMCFVSLTIDHRLLDGAVADQFLTVVKDFVEQYAE